MARPLDTADFRAIRIVLEPDDLAVSDDKPDGLPIWSIKQRGMVE